MKATKERKTYDVADVFRKIPRVEGHTAYINTPPPKEQHQGKYGIKNGDKIKPEALGK